MALAMHRKWQIVAESLGGKDARIVVSKPDAKKLIFELLSEAFRPMNISDLFKALKGVVPSQMKQNSFYVSLLTRRQYRRSAPMKFILTS